MAERARIVEYVLDSEGRPIPGATITIREPGTVTPIAETLYAADDPDTSQLTNGAFFSGADGKVVAYTAANKRADMLVTKSGYTSQTIPVDFQKSSLLSPHVLTGSDHTVSGLTGGHVLRATGATTFAFEAIADADLPASIARDTEILVVATFDLLDTESVRTGVRRWYNRTGVALTIIDVFLHLGTAPTGASFITDVNKNGTTIFTTQTNRPTVLAAGSTDAADAIEVSSLANGDYLTADVDQIGSGTPGGKGTLQVTMRRS